MEPWNHTATQILENIRSGNLTVEQYASSLLERIKQRDDDVKAWAYLDPKAVLEQARKLDQVPKDQRGPLHGLPVGIKDIILTKGKTTTTEFAASFTGPATRNAHSTAHTPGGSSAGSAAAVADFQIPVALGSQTVGSIVRPAAFNGIYGFKPTWGAVTREGQKFCAPTVDTIGFFSRSVSDFETLADVFALHDDEKSTFEDIKGSKFAVCGTSKWDLAGDGTIAAMDKAAELLKAHGAEVEELDLGPDFDQVIDWHLTLVRLEGATSLWPEYYQDKDKLDPVLAKGVEEKHKISRKAQLDAYDGLAALRPRFDKMADDYVAVLVPSVFDEAPEGLGNTGSPVFAATWTALHTPVVNIPGFRGKSNLPVGVSLVSARLRDRHLLKVSEAVGRIFEAEGGWNQ
ncbi:amidase [Fusarium pseudoanthophilum]|uniref:Amidase n=1 Tax=Fusarium pseudoanthophilum TaxID=48495 RepID=A0A8H5PQE5_9HYPO|nr:amidase [Fusarium pseudoanthophilum]